MSYLVLKIIETSKNEMPCMAADRWTIYGVVTEKLDWSHLLGNLESEY